MKVKNLVNASFLFGAIFFSGSLLAGCPFMPGAIFCRGASNAVNFYIEYGIDNQQLKQDHMSSFLKQYGCYFAQDDARYEVTILYHGRTATEDGWQSVYQVNVGRGNSMPIRNLIVHQDYIDSTCSKDTIRDISEGIKRSNEDVIKRFDNRK